MPRTYLARRDSSPRIVAYKVLAFDPRRPKALRIEPSLIQALALLGADSLDGSFNRHKVLALCLVRHRMLLSRRLQRGDASWDNR